MGRNHKKFNHKKEEKKYHNLLIELDKLNKLQRELPYVKLEEPIQKGWNSYYTLRKDISKRKDANSIEEALKLGFKKNKYIHSSKYVKMIREGATFYIVTTWDGKTKEVSLTPDIVLYKAEKFESMDLKPSVFKWFTSYIDKYNKKVYKLDMPKYFLTLKCKKRMVDKIQSFSPDLEKDLSIVKDKLNYYYRHNFMNHKNSGKDSDLFLKGRVKTKLQNLIKEELCQK
jgi:hypothetical protein